MRNGLAALVVDAWQDMDRVLARLSPQDLVRQVDGSSAAWTLAHVTQQVDSWINMRFQQLAPHPLIRQDQFRMGGTGAADDCPAIERAVRDVRALALPYLTSLEEVADPVIPYDGSLMWIRDKGLGLRFALARISTHHYLHIGEIAAKRNQLGVTGDLTADLAAGAGLIAEQ